MYFIGIDSGTQSTKSLVADGESGKILAVVSHPTPLIQDLPPGHKEQHPDDWRQALRISLKAALEESGIDPLMVRGIGVSGQQHGFVPLDEKGNVIRPAKLWCDTSTAPQCETILDRVGGLENCIDLIGNGIPAGFTASKILWLKENEPENYSRLKTVILPHDYINFRLTGNLVMEWGDASGTALMDIRTRKWKDELISAIDPELRKKLPPLHPSSEAAGIILPEVAAEFGFSKDVIVSAGGGDNMMGAIGTGNVIPGIVTASIGTSGTIYACSATPVADPEGEIAGFCDSTGKWLPLLCVMNVTTATEMARGLFGMDHEALDKAVENVPAGSHGLILLPYFEGERTPDVPDGTGTWFGLNDGTMKPEIMCRSAMEGATMTMNYGLNRLRDLGIDPVEIRLTGGGSNSRAWRKMAADIFNAEVVAMEHAEGAAFGAALQAKWTFENSRGENVDIADLAKRWVRVDESTREKPDPENVEKYKTLQDIFDHLSLSLRRVFTSHREFIEKE